MSGDRANGQAPGPTPKTLRDWLPLVYEKASERAHRLLTKWSGLNRPGTASLVHQAFCRLSESGVEQCESHDHALALLVQKMRQQLVDLARKIDAKKRGGRGQSGQGTPVLRRHLLSEEIASPQGWEPADYLALDEALGRLQEFSPRLARVVELRFLIGLTHQETADELHLSRMSVHSDWQLAKAWLYNELSGASVPRKASAEERS